MHSSYEKNLISIQSLCHKMKCNFLMNEFSFVTLEKVMGKKLLIDNSAGSQYHLHSGLNKVACGLVASCCTIKRIRLVYGMIDCVTLAITLLIV